mgnify:CR=1 FL=1
MCKENEIIQKDIKDYRNNFETILGHQTTNKFADSNQKKTL